MNVTVFSASDLNCPPAAPGPDTLALWLLPVSDSGLAGLDFRHLSDREQERCARISRPEERQRYQVAHAALRRILSSYLNCPAQTLVFSANQYGKPYLSYPLDPGAGQLHFSLSHSGGCGPGLLRQLPGGRGYRAGPAFHQTTGTGRAVLSSPGSAPVKRPASPGTKNRFSQALDPAGSILKRPGNRILYRLRLLRHLPGPPSRRLLRQRRRAGIFQLGASLP